MDGQKVFEIVAKHLFKQGKRAFLEKQKVCVYRGPDNTSCAVGCLIPDGIYDSHMEGMRINAIVVEYSGVMPDYIVQNSELLYSLQFAHDASRNWATTEDMKLALETIAIRYNFNIDFLSDLSFSDR